MYFAFNIPCVRNHTNTCSSRYHTDHLKTVIPVLWATLIRDKGQRHSSSAWDASCISVCVQWRHMFVNCNVPYAVICTVCPECRWLSVPATVTNGKSWTPRSNPDASVRFLERCYLRDTRGIYRIVFDGVGLWRWCVNHRHSPRILDFFLNRQCFKNHEISEAGCAAVFR
jgi:hypothetical protein